MPSPTLLSPNTGNLYIGKGALSFKKSGDAGYRHMGNCASIEFTPSNEKLDHFSSLEGVRSKDYSIVIQKGGAIKIVMEEHTAANLQLMLLGTVDEDAIGGPTIQIFDQNTIDGELTFVGANDIGPKLTAFFHNVSFSPSGALSFLSDEWGQMEATAEVLVAGSLHEHAGEFGYVKITNLSDGS